MTVTLPLPRTTPIITHRQIHGHKSKGRAGPITEWVKMQREIEQRATSVTVTVTVFKYDLVPMGRTLTDRNGKLTGQKMRDPKSYRGARKNAKRKPSHTKKGK